MKKTAIIAIVEPLSFALNTSAAWALTRTLNAGKTFTLFDSKQTDVGTLIGLTPVLQPIKTVISGQSGFFLAMRAVLDVSAGFAIDFDAKYSLVDSDSHAKGVLTSCSSARHAYTAPFTLLSPQLPQLAAADVSALQAHVVYLTESLWHKEPINWTTHGLQYASTGQLMTKNEIVASGLATGMPVFANGTLSIAPGPKPLQVPFGRWPRAGITTAVGVADAAEASCSSEDTSTGGTTGDGACL
jgi:hypothetical protein